MGSYTQQKLYDQEIHTISIPESVRLSGIATSEIIAEAAAFLHKDGIIVLENAIEIAHLSTLNDVLSKEALDLASNRDHHFNFGSETRNMDQAPPPTPFLMFKDVWCNNFAAAAISAVLGPHPHIHYANGNTALRASPTGRQPVHSDCDFQHPAYFPFCYVINIPLVTVTEDNGATEVWPGSHHVSTASAHVAPNSTEHMLVIDTAHREQRRIHSPPVRACTSLGSLIIRDLRLWHAGMPNLTDEPRVMLAFAAQPAWFQARSKVKLPASARELVEGWETEGEFVFDAEYVEGEVDYKKLTSEGVDFDTNSAILNQHRQKLAALPGWMPEYY